MKHNVLSVVELDIGLQRTFFYTHSTLKNNAKSAGTHVHCNEIIRPRDPRSGLFDVAKRCDIEGLMRRGTFKLFMREEPPSNPHIGPSRFVLNMKRKENGT